MGEGESSGATCVVAGVRKQQDGRYACYLANAGDSRGLLIRRTSQTVHHIVASEDHKPNREDEQARVLAANGFLKRGRLDGNLAVSRGFADFKFKQDRDKSPAEQKLSCVPELYLQTLYAGDLIVLASDGVWDVVESERLVKILCENRTRMDLGMLCKAVVEYLFKHLGATDNMTLMIIELGLLGEDDGQGDEDMIVGDEQMGALDGDVQERYKRFIQICEEDAAYCNHPLEVTSSHCFNCGYGSNSFRPTQDVLALASGDSHWNSKTPYPPISADRSGGSGSSRLPVWEPLSPELHNIRNVHTFAACAASSSSSSAVDSTASRDG